LKMEEIREIRAPFEDGQDPQNSRPVEDGGSARSASR